MASPRSASPDQRNSPREDFGDGKVANTGETPVATDAERTMSDAEKKDASPEVEWLSGLRLWLVMMPLCFAFFLVLLDISIIATAVPQITNDFQSLADVGWYGAAYQLASAALQPLTGKIYVNFKNKWVFLSFFGLFELGSLLCGVATSSKMLIVGRAVQGMGTAGLQNGAFTIISASAPLVKRPVLIGICQGIAQLGGVIGPLIGGALTQYTTWRWCFYINLPPGAIVAVLIFFSKIPEGQIVKPKAAEVVKDIHNRLDFVGFFLFAPSITMLLLAVQWGGNEYAWNSATVIGLFCGFAGNFLVWAAYNYWKGDKALIPFSMMKLTVVWTSCLFLAVLMGAMMVANYYLPIYFQAVDGVTPTMSGVYMLPSILAQLFAAVFAGRLVGVVGRYTPFVFACVILTSIGYGLCSTFSIGTSTGEWIGYQILFGAGRGLGFQMPIVAVQNTLPPTQAPIGMSIIMFSGMLGGALLLSFSATIFTQSLRKEIPIQDPGADARAIVAAGATEFRKILDPSELGGILTAYAKSIDRVFYLITALTAVSFFLAFGLGFKDIREKTEPPKEDKEVVEKV
ncbi:hypothetical protein Q7P35_002941 [Cladosporium inversicolor]